MAAETRRCMLRWTCVSFLFIHVFICVKFGCCMAVSAVMLPKTEREREKQAGAVSSGKPHNLSHPTQVESIQEPCTMLFTLEHFVSLHVSIDGAGSSDTTRHDTYFKIQVYEFSRSSLGFLSGSCQCQYRISRTNS